MMILKNRITDSETGTSSSTFAYIFGVVCGDGYARVRKAKGRTSGEIILKVNDEDFAQTFKDYLERWSDRTAKLKYDGKRHCTYLCSKFHAGIILNYDIEQIFLQNNDFKYAFLRGLFDSDGGIVAKNLNERRKAKRWLHFSNSDAQIIYAVRKLFREFGLKYSFTSRIHSGFGSERIQYEIKVYNLQGLFFYYKNIGFSIQRKQEDLKKTISSYDYYSSELFNKAKELHKTMGFRKIAKEINVPENVVYRWLFKDYKDKIIDMDGGKNGCKNIYDENLPLVQEN